VQNDDFLSKYPSFSEPPCNDCYDKYLDEKDQLSRSLKNYADYKQTNLVKTNGLFLSELPIEATIASIIEPLSHESRFEMLKALSTGSMTFKELSELTNSKGGHLIYHITKLVDAGLVIKIDAGKRYSITDRGLSMMVFIKQLCSQ